MCSETSDFKTNIARPTWPSIDQQQNEGGLTFLPSERAPEIEKWRNEPEKRRVRRIMKERNSSLYSTILRLERRNKSQAVTIRNHHSATIYRSSNDDDDDGDYAPPPCDGDSDNDEAVADMSVDDDDDAGIEFDDAIIAAAAAAAVTVAEQSEEEEEEDEYEEDEAGELDNLLKDIVHNVIVDDVHGSGGRRIYTCYLCESKTTDGDPCSSCLSKLKLLQRY